MCLFENIEFAEAIEATCEVTLARENSMMSVRGILNVSQPVVDQPKWVSLVGGYHPAATVMTANDDVLHSQHIDGVLKRRQTVEICVDDQICDVSMHEHFAWQESYDLICRYATVRTTNP